MKLFKTLFNLMKLPVAIVADSFTAIPDLMAGDAFVRTRKVCDEIDDAIGEK